MVELDDLLVLISPERPCGDDLSFSLEYDRIQDARRSDDPTLEQGEWVTDLKSADWPAVLQQSSQLLKERSKDLQLGVWFAEAAARTYGFRGLALGYRLVAGLCDQYWDTLYPTAEDGDYEQRIGNFSWLLTHSIDWMKEIPLTQGQHGGFGYLHFETARRRQKNPDEQAAANDGLPSLEVLENARRTTSHDFYRELIDALLDCQQALQSLETAVDLRLGVDGPSFSAAREQLPFLANLVQRSARDAGMFLQDDGEAIGDDGDTDITGPVSGDPQESGSGNGPLNSRREALLQLRRVAEFFRRTEPHSPVAYLADKAARWGEMPLHEWLRRVIKDDNILTQLQELLDVDDSSQGSNH
ncbi:MAG: type VI secretion system protein TssA [Xanthomonadaceae bacterium]|jgi:type VI secretion system protein ImpA|nr:type VI secretion system protein TssA [Xanthomonadaceae bacterium]